MAPTLLFTPPAPSAGACWHALLLLVLTRFAGVTVIGAIIAAAAAAKVALGSCHEGSRPWSTHSRRPNMPSCGLQ
jgi:hypothetical protein